MLLDTRKMKAIKAEDQRDWHPCNYAQDNDVYLYTIICVSAGERMTGEDSDPEIYAGTVDFMTSFDFDGSGIMSTEEAEELLDNGGTVYLGPNDDRYAIVSLQEPVAQDRWGEIVPLACLAGVNGFEEPFDCRAGVDYPASLTR